MPRVKPVRTLEGAGPEAAPAAPPPAPVPHPAAVVAPKAPAVADEPTPVEATAAPTMMPPSPQPANPGVTVKGDGSGTVIYDFRQPEAAKAFADR